MDKLMVPDLAVLKTWLEHLNIAYYECDACDSLHLHASQEIDGLVDAKLDVIDNTLVCSASTVIRPSAIMPLMAELNQINAAILMAKVFIDIQDDNLPRLIICQAVSVAQGLSQPQFHGFITEFEDQITQIVLDIKANNLLLTDEKDGLDDDAMIFPTPQIYQFH